MKPVFTQILDSRGNPTIQASFTDLQLKVAVPSGASTGVHEAHELRDETSSYRGKAVTKAIANAQELSESIDWSIANFHKVDEYMIKRDGTSNKTHLGANALLAISMLQVLTQAHQNNQEVYELIAQTTESSPALPLPFANVINGGQHADNSLMMQEFMIVPIHAKTFAEASQQVAETYQALKQLIAKRYGSSQTALGDEGGFAPAVKDAFEACELLVLAMKKSGHQMAIAMDPAASEFYKEQGYEAVEGEYMTAQQLSDYYVKLVQEYPIISIEDPFDQDDFSAFAHLKSLLTDHNCQVVGDDLTVSNPKRIQQAITSDACNSLLLKINQIGTISEALQAAQLAKEHSWTVMVSHRSGETEDTFIADLATGIGSGQIKLGAPARGERTAKYNRLLTIEQTSSLSLADHPWQNL